MTVASLPVPLSFLQLEHKGEEPITPFDATLHTIPITVTAVLEKTLVYEIGTDEWPKREQARPTDVLVDPLALSWRPRGTVAKPGDPRTWRRGHKRALTDEERQEATARNEKLVSDSKRGAEARLAADLAADRRRVEAAAVERRAEDPVADPPHLVVLPDRLVWRPIIVWPHLDPELIKRCPRCTFIKPREGYAKNKVTPDGLQTQCRQCMSRYWKHASAETLNDVKPEHPNVAEPVRNTVSMPTFFRTVFPWPALDPELVKRCKNCSFIKPRTSFSTHPRANDGLQSWCQLCMTGAGKAGKAEQLARNRLAKPEVTEKFCPKCETLKDVEDFALNRSKPDGRQAYCRDCMRRANIDWGSRHKPATTAAEIVLDQLENMLEGVGGLRAELQAKDLRIQELEVEVARLLQTVNLIAHLEQLTGRLEQVLTQPRGHAVRLAPGTDTEGQVKATLQRLGFTAGEARSAIASIQWTPELTAAAALTIALKALAPS
jgi:hypothetical protein